MSGVKKQQREAFTLIEGKRHRTDGSHDSMQRELRVLRGRLAAILATSVALCLVLLLLLHLFRMLKEKETPEDTAVQIDESCDNITESKVTSARYGVLKDGGNVTSYTLRNDHMHVKILNYGGIITQIEVPGKNGKTDIILGFDNLEDYVEHNVLFGAIVGRYANVIAGKKFKLDGVTYAVQVNYDVGVNGSKIRGFSKRLWNSHVEDDRSVVLTYSSQDGENGFPGNVNVTVSYELTDKNELIISYKATTSHATVINLTNRSFFNLGGHTSGSLDDHMVRIIAPYYTPVGDKHIPTGVKAAVEGTMYDIRANTLLGPRLPKVPGGHGFDTNFAVGRPSWDKHMARVTHRKSGRTLDVYSTEPGLHFNTGHHLQGIKGKGGLEYKQYAGFSLEAQHYPNSPNEPRFPTTILRPGTAYTQTTKYVFGVAV